MKLISLVMLCLCVAVAFAQPLRLKRAIIVSGDNEPTAENEQDRLKAIQQVLEAIPPAAKIPIELPPTPTAGAPGAAAAPTGIPAVDGPAAGAPGAAAAGAEKDPADKLDEELNKSVSSEINRLEAHLDVARKYADKIPTLEERLKMLRNRGAQAAADAAKRKAQKALAEQERHMTILQGKIKQLRSKLRQMKAARKQLSLTIEATKAELEGKQDDNEACEECEEEMAKKGKKGKAGGAKKEKKSKSESAAPAAAPAPAAASAAAPAPAAAAEAAPAASS